MRLLFPSFLILIVAAPVLASDGVLEINQACAMQTGCFAGDTAGFPVEIVESGSYVLTSDLDVPENTSGVLLGADHITLDLSGFGVRGPGVCQPGSCATGSASGILVNTNQRYVTLKHGQVHGFSDRCVKLFGGSRVEGLLIHDCGRIGLETGGHSVLLGNQVLNTGQGGVQSGAGTVFANNTIGDTTLNNGGYPALQGGSPTGGNFCDDGSCTARGERRFYLTIATFDGATAPGACAAGFHMASIWEILDPTALRYDTTRGITTEDSGLGPPSTHAGWVRTGKPGVNHSTSPGGASCSGYTSSSGDGTRVALYRNWEPGFLTEDDSRLPWWLGRIELCNLPGPVWCVED